MSNIARLKEEPQGESKGNPDLWTIVKMILRLIIEVVGFVAAVKTIFT